MLARPHILFVIDTFYGTNAGGAESMLLKMVRLLADRYRCSVATFAIHPDAVGLNRFPCPVHVLPLRRTYDWRALKVALRLRELIRSENVSIVHTFFETADLWGGAIAKLSGCPVVVSSRRDMGISRLAKHRLAYRVLGGLYDRVLTVSDEVRRFSIGEDRLPPEKVMTVYNGLELPEVDRAEPCTEARAMFGPAGAEKLIVTVGNLRPVKGTDVVIRAAARVCREFPSARFLVIGGILDPAYFDSLRELTSSLGLADHVRFATDVTDVFPWLKAADIFCLLSRSEGLSNALLEAMACGLPCVASRVGGNSEALADGRSGYLVPPEQPDIAAERILTLLRDPGRGRHMGEAGRKTIEGKFTAERMIGELAGLYDQLLKRRRPVEIRPGAVAAEPAEAGDMERTQPMISSAADTAGAAAPGAPARPARRLHKAALVLLAAVTAFGAGTIASTYGQFSQAIDEPAHVACGMEWWSNHTYTYEYQHPPISRIAAAAPLYAAGIRLPAREPNVWTAGNQILRANGQYETNLALARLGSLFFYILSVVFTYLLAARLSDPLIAALAATLYATLPKVLGIGSLAYTDTALVAGFTCFALCWLRWAERRTVASDVLLGASLAFAVGSKYSAIPFILVAGAAWLTLVAVRRRLTLRPLLAIARRHRRHLLLVALTAFLCAWAVFRFSLTPLLVVRSEHPFIDGIVGASGSLHDVTYKILGTPVPLAEVVKGIFEVAGHDQIGHPTYAFGRSFTFSPWYFFPLLVALTTPIPLLLLVGARAALPKPAGGSIAARSGIASIPVLCAAAILFVALFSSIGIGIRHVLPVFPFLAILAAEACAGLWRRGCLLARVAVPVLVAAELACCVLAYPDFLAYTNALVLNPEWRSAHDVDYGQDAKRLAEVLRAEGIPSVSVALSGRVQLDRMGFPPHTVLKPFTPTEGWVAVSLLRLKLDNSFQWLTRYRPERTVGETIQLYRIPASEGAATPAGKGTTESRKPRLKPAAEVFSQVRQVAGLPAESVHDL